MKLPTIEQHIKGWLLVIVIGGAFLGYLRFFDGDTLRPVIDSNRESFEYQTNKTIYQAGEKIEVKTRSFCKLRNAKATHHFVLEDHVLLPFLTEESNIPTGCYDAGKSLTLVELPGFVGTDTYRIRGTTCYQVNPIRQICYPFTTNEFLVTKSNN